MVKGDWNLWTIGPLRNLSALAITETELKLMAAAAIIGFRRRPKAG